ncbi:hypothetical protein WICMUC_001293 [Wickerhamomyces mucosus]|uniref:chitinase n=1 Tax=Wickerhamomyces mucosus TaxID=1378264 RepID=A0A9P8THG9_9ASCO|nr:hypothetical protein WICMUC_001293 [Wickerhamomyces mucosus]
MKFFQTLTAVSGLLSTVYAAFDANSNQNVVLYWGQASAGSQQDLSYYCESDDVDIIVLAFMSTFPGTDDVPTLNFASACTDTFSNGLLKCDQIATDIQTCQSNGKKVLLSMGGSAGSYGFADDDSAEEFATTLWNLFGEGESDTKPFGDTLIDGFDFDIENNLSTGYAALAGKLRTYFASGSKTYYLSAAPQCVYPDASVGDLLESTDIDFAFVQFYNNYCNVDKQFNWDTWSSYASTVSPNSNIKLYLGLPGSSTAAGSGYVDIDTIKSTLESIGSDSHFGGIMLWDASQGFTNTVNGETFVAAIKNALTSIVTGTSSTSSSTASNSLVTSSVLTSTTVITSSNTASRSTSSTSSTSTSYTSTSSTSTSSTSTSSTSTSSTSSTSTSSTSTSSTSTSSTSSTSTSSTSTSSTSTSSTSSTSTSSTSTSSTSTSSTSSTSTSSTSTSSTSTSSTSASTSANLTPTTSLPTLTSSSTPSLSSTSTLVPASTSTSAITPTEILSESVLLPNIAANITPTNHLSALESSTVISNASNEISEFIEVTTNTFVSGPSTLSTIVTSSVKKQSTVSSRITSPVSTSSTSSGIISGCSSLSGDDKVLCLNAQYKAGQFSGSPNSCTNGDISCTADGSLASCNWGSWVVESCATGTSCYAYTSNGEVFTGCNFSQNYKRSLEHSHHDHI